MKDVKLKVCPKECPNVKLKKMRMQFHKQMVKDVKAYQDSMAKLGSFGPIGEGFQLKRTLKKMKPVKYVRGPAPNVYVYG